MKIHSIIAVALLGVLEASAEPTVVQNITIEVSSSVEKRERNQEELSGVTMIGAVNKPGVIKIEDSISVKDSISRAGGMTQFAYGRHLIILAGTPLTKFAFRIPHKVTDAQIDLLFSRIILKKGDFLLVPEIME